MGVVTFVTNSCCFLWDIRITHPHGSVVIGLEVKMARRKRAQLHCCPHHIKTNYFWKSLLVDKEKKPFSGPQTDSWCLELCGFSTGRFHICNGSWSWSPQDVKDRIICSHSSRPDICTRTLSSLRSLLCVLLFPAGSALCSDLQIPPVYFHFTVREGEF